MRKIAHDAPLGPRTQAFSTRGIKKTSGAEGRLNASAIQIVISQISHSFYFRSISRSAALTQPLYVAALAPEEGTVQLLLVPALGQWPL